MLGCKTLSSSAILCFSCRSLQKWHSSSLHQLPAKKNGHPKNTHTHTHTHTKKQLHPFKSLLAVCMHWLDGQQDGHARDFRCSCVYQRCFARPFPVSFIPCTVLVRHHFDRKLPLWARGMGLGTSRLCILVNVDGQTMAPVIRAQWNLQDGVAARQCMFPEEFAWQPLHPPGHPGLQGIVFSLGASAPFVFRWVIRAGGQGSMHHVGATTCETGCRQNRVKLLSHVVT